MPSIVPPSTDTQARATIPLSRFTYWLAFGERGLSSEAICYFLSGNPVPPPWGPTVRTPSDPDDFRRCQLLLEQVPLAAVAFPAMRNAGPRWARLVDAWDEIHSTIEAEAPDYMHKREGSAPKGYRLMRRILAGGVECRTCDGTRQAEECEKCNGTGRRSGGRCRARGCYRGYGYCKPCHGSGYTDGDA